MRRNTPKIRGLHSLVALVLAATLATSYAAAAATYRYPLLGRLTEPNGHPVEGPVDLQVAFYRIELGGEPLVVVTASHVILQEGIFQLAVSLSQSDFQTVFSSMLEPVYVEITDLTHDPKAPYPR